LSGTTRASRYQKVHVTIFWILWCKMKMTQADAQTICMDCHPIQTNWCPHLCYPTIIYARHKFTCQSDENVSQNSQSCLAGSLDTDNCLSDLLARSLDSPLIALWLLFFHWTRESCISKMMAKPLLHATFEHFEHILLQFHAICPGLIKRCVMGKLGKLTTLVVDSSFTD